MSFRQQRDLPVLHHPHQACAQRLGFRPAEAFQRGAIFGERGHPHADIDLAAMRGDAHLHEARILCAIAAFEQTLARQPRHQPAHARLRDHGRLRKFGEIDVVMGGEHGEDAPVLERIAALAQFVGQILVHARDQPVHQIRQKIVEAFLLGHVYPRIAGSQVAIGG